MSGMLRKGAVPPRNGYVGLVLLVALFASAAVGLKIDEKLEMNLELIKHQACSFKSGKSRWERKLELEAGDDKTGPKLLTLPSMGPNCYSISGKVNVFSEFKGEFSIYLELRSSVNKRQVPEVCSNQRADGCGGFGSCLYCDACETLTSAKSVNARLLLNNKSIGCTDGLHPGAYDSLQLVFCLPEFEEILRSQGLTVEQFKQLAQTEEGAQALRSIGIFATIYVFDTDVRKLMQTQTKVEQVYRRTKPAFFHGEPLPPEVYWSLPFNSLIKEQKQFVACHKIYGNVKVKSMS